MITSLPLVLDHGDREIGGAPGKGKEPAVGAPHENPGSILPPEDPIDPARLTALGMRLIGNRRGGPSSDTDSQSSGAAPVKQGSASAGSGHALAGRDGSGDQLSDDERVGPLRELRQEVQDLQATLDIVSKGTIPLTVFAPYMKTAQGHMRGMIDQLEVIPGLIDRSSIRHIRDVWEGMCTNPVFAQPDDESLAAQAQLNYLALLQSQCHDLVLQIGYLSIPTRLNVYLENSKPGYYIPFHTVFEDEVPSQEDRVKILTWLAYSPRRVKGGLIDVEPGLIYRYSKQWGWQLFTFLLAVGTLAIFTVAVLVSARIPISGWPVKQGDSVTMLAGWAAILAGVVVHLGVDTAKRMQARASSPPVLALGDALPFVNARIGRLLLRLLMALVGFYFLLFTVGVSKVGVLDFFLGGYTLDSIVNLFGTTADQRSAGQITAIKQRLGV